MSFKQKIKNLYKAMFPNPPRSGPATAHVVCCNDTPAVVVLGTEEKARAVCARYKANWQNTMRKTYEGQNVPMAYWHVVDHVDIVEK